MVVVMTALLWLAGLLHCAEEDHLPPMHMPQGQPVEITIDGSRPAGRLDERYIGFAFDTAQFTGGKWWQVGANERQVVETPDLENEKFRKLISQLAPTRMRIGGTDCDAVYFCPEEGECELPAAYQHAFIDKENRLPTVLTHEDIRRAADFAAAVDASIMLCVNMGAGPREEETGQWTPDNARTFIRYVKSLANADRFDIWEAGNEVNVLSVHFHTPQFVDPVLFASDLQTFRKLVDEEAPGALVAAPGAYFSPFADVGDFEFTAKLLPLVPDLIDVLTWHLYAAQSESCPRAPNPASQESLFDESLVQTHRLFAQQVAEAGGGLPVMNGETASAQCGGQMGISDTLLDALWYADWIGIMAKEGTSAVVRQTIVGGDYGLLDPVTFDPRPTFLALVMFRRTVQRYRLQTVADRSLIKAHGYCSAPLDGSVTAVLANPSAAALVGQIGLVGTTVADATQWTVTAHNAGGLTATRATIEGLAADEDGSIPNPAGTAVHIVDGRAYASVAPNSLVFVVLQPKTVSSPCLQE